MGLTTKEIKTIQDEIEFAKDPIYFFHDDPDGLCSFLLFYRQIRAGKGIVVKTRPNIDEKFLRKVQEYDPDKIFVLDIANVEQDFVDTVKKPMIWIDHHGVQDIRGIKYFNPRKHKKDDNVPVSSMCYDVVQKDMWIGMVGTVGDWTLPHFTDKFKKEYPDLLPEDVNRPEDALFATELGKLIRIFSFILKGTTSDALKYVRVLTRIDSPYEILKQETSQGRFIYKKYQTINKYYQELLKDIISKVGKEKMIVYLYPESKMSFTGDVTNELLYRYPDRIIIVGRESSGEMKCSLRSPKNLPIEPGLQRALVGVEGYGGGHENACGAVIKKEDFETFIEQFKKEMNIS